MIEPVVCQPRRVLSIAARSVFLLVAIRHNKLAAVISGQSGTVVLHPPPSALQPRSSYLQIPLLARPSRRRMLPMESNAGLLRRPRCSPRQGKRRAESRTMGTYAAPRAPSHGGWSGSTRCHQCHPTTRRPSARCPARSPRRAAMLSQQSQLHQVLAVRHATGEQRATERGLARTTIRNCRAV